MTYDALTYVRSLLVKDIDNLYEKSIDAMKAYVQAKRNGEPKEVLADLWDKKQEAYAIESKARDVLKDFDSHNFR